MDRMLISRSMFRRALCTSLALLMGSACSFGQTIHQVILSWTASVDAASNPSLTYNVYRLSGSCPTVLPTDTTGFTKVNTTAVTGTTFTDSSVGIGIVCYIATSQVNGSESLPSNTAQANVRPKGPTVLGITSVQ